MNQVLIHCKTEALEDIKKLGLPYNLNDGEVDIIVEDIEYDPEHYFVDPDEQLCNFYEIDYNTQVNCVELA